MADLTEGGRNSDANNTAKLKLLAISLNNNSIREVIFK